MAEGYEILSKTLTPNFDYYGFDYSENMVDIAPQRKPALKIEWNDVTAYQSTGDLFDCHFKSAGYEKVDEVYPGLLAYVLYYNPDAFPALNVRGTFLVKSLFTIDRLFWNNWLGRKLSFATMSLWRRN